MIHLLPVTAVFACILTLLILMLAYRVVVYRRRYRVGYGEGKKDHLKQAISAHSNAIENIPLAILLMALLEYAEVPFILLVIVACLFVLARFIHAYGLSHSIGVSFGRTYGTMLSWFLLGFMAILNVIYSFS